MIERKCCQEIEKILVETERHREKDNRDSD